MGLLLPLLPLLSALPLPLLLFACARGTKRRDDDADEGADERDRPHRAPGDLRSCIVAVLMCWELEPVGRIKRKARSKNNIVHTLSHFAATILHVKRPGKVCQACHHAPAVWICWLGAAGGGTGCCRGVAATHHQPTPRTARHSTQMAANKQLLDQSCHSNTKQST